MLQRWTRCLRKTLWPVSQTLKQMPSQKQRELRAQIQRKADARPRPVHEALKKEAVKAKEEAARQEAEARTTPQRTGGSGTLFASARSRPPVLGFGPALRRTNPRRRTNTPTRADAERGRKLSCHGKGVDAQNARRGRRAFDGRLGGPTISRLQHRGYCRPAPSRTFTTEHICSRTNMANEQQITIFAPTASVRSRPFVVGVGAGPRAECGSRPRSNSEEQRLEVKRWAQLKNDC